MDVVSLSPLRVGSLLWRSQRGAWVQTVVCKATYSLRPGESPLAGDQEYPNDEDNHWDDDPERSLSSPSDLAPFKPRADVLLVGHCFAPRAAPVGSLVARLVVGTIDKSIEVCGERSFTGEGLREGTGFAKMSLRWERAAGGPDSANPVGVRFDPGSDAAGARSLPNLLPPGATLSSSRCVIDPIGYGPIAAAWPTRRQRLGRHTVAWSGAQWHGRELPDDIDPAYFNTAPGDQQLDVLRNDERIVLENLHPDHERLVTHLPGVRPRAFVERPGEAPRDLLLVADTLWIDTDRRICTLTWRGQIPLESPQAPGRVLVAMETRHERLQWSDVARLAVTDTLEGTGTVDSARAVEPAGNELPFVVHGAGSEAPGAVQSAAPTSKRSDLPIPGDRAPAWLRPSVPSAATERAAQPAPRPPSVAPAALHAPVVGPASQALAPAVAPPTVDSPWAAAARGRAGEPHVDPVGAQLHRPQAGPQVAAPVADTTNASNVDVLSSAGAASNAAALDVPVAAPVPAPRAGRAMRVAVELLWFDPDAVGRLRETPAFRDLCAEPPPKPRDDFDFDAEPPPEIPREVTDKKTVVAVLSGGIPVDGDGLVLAMAEAVGDDGTFVPPLVVVDGDLVFPFDDLETLKATVTAVTPLIAGDKKLKETVDTVNELLQTPWLQSGATIAEGLTARVKETFAQGNRMLPASHLETHTDRILLEQRHYQRRTVFGEAHIRCLLTPTGNGSAIPTYLPDALSKKLPMFQTFRGRVIAEAQVQQDQHETHACALRVVALGRAISVPRR